MNAKIVEFSDDNYKEVLDQHSLIFVDCWAEWCQPCLALNPLFDKLAEEFTGKLTIAKLNVDESPVLREKYDISGLPAFLVFESGKFLTKYPWMFFSLHPEVTLRKAMTDLLDEQ